MTFAGLILLSALIPGGSLAAEPSKPKQSPGIRFDSSWDHGPGQIPSGFRAREIYRILGPDEFMERFEIAEPNSEFAVYSEARLKRKK